MIEEFNCCKCFIEKICVQALPFISMALLASLTDIKKRLNDYIAVSALGDGLGKLFQLCQQYETLYQVEQLYKFRLYKICSDYSPEWREDTTYALTSLFCLCEQEGIMFSIKLQVGFH